MSRKDLFTQKLSTIDNFTSPRKKNVQMIDHLYDSYTVKGVTLLTHPSVNGKHCPSISLGKREHDIFEQVYIYEEHTTNHHHFQPSRITRLTDHFMCLSKTACEWNEPSKRIEISQCLGTSKTKIVFSFVSFEDPVIVRASQASEVISKRRGAYCD
jgi:hypothetical protein